MTVKGKVHKYGDNVDTDVIIPARYLNTASHAELAAHCMEDIDAGFAKRVKAGDIIVGGENFGCGSSREHAPIAIKACGVSCVIAKSFARIFYRNAINIGLPILELRSPSAHCAEAGEPCPPCQCPSPIDEIAKGDEVEVDFDSGIIKNLTKAEQYQAIAFPEFIKEIIDAGGLLTWLNK
ncbi:MAG: 3-isopropylmalate dehydratase small subunit [Oscillospiraceae bacterium]|nr:3-isopropylmalate dehydratase small subunit [Oscillospiraceae bacterium]